jgi:antitoxin component of RelBE/YafQ-DinJ toxin-antitoxin module
MDNMKNNKLMQTRINREFEAHARAVAESQGLNLSSFVRLAIAERIKLLTSRSHGPSV